MYYVYILTNSTNTVLYTGVTNNLQRRTEEHKAGVNDGFSKRYLTHKLVYFEEVAEIKAAIEREKQIKGWMRYKKIRLIESINREWKDLSL